MNGSLYIEIYTRKFEKYFCTINAILALKKAPQELLRAYVLLDTETIYVKYCAWKFNIHLNLRFHFNILQICTSWSLLLQVLFIDAPRAVAICEGCHKHFVRR